MSSGSTSQVPPAFIAVLPRARTDIAAHLDLTDVELMPAGYQDRPFSFLLRVAIGSDHAKGRGFFLKVFKTNPNDGGIEKMRCRVAHDYDVTRRIAAAMAPYPDLGVVRPVACYLDELTIVTEEAPGRTLTAYLEAKARWFPSSRSVRELEGTLAHVGRWLRTFQATDVAGGPLDLDGLRDYVDVRLKRLVANGVYSETYRQEVLQHLRSLATDVPPDARTEVVVHADMAPGNILVSPGCVTVIDLVMVQRGSRLHDISRLYLQLDVMRAKPQFRSAVIRRLQDALLKGFDPGLTADAPLFRFLSLLHRINHLSTLSLKPEKLPGALLSRQVLRLHRNWIDAQLRRSRAGMARQ